MGELFVEEGSLPGDAPLTLTGADGTICIRGTVGGDRRAPVRRHLHPRPGEGLSSRAAFLQFNKTRRTSIRSSRFDKDTWRVVFDKIHSPGHEIGFLARRKFLV